jgi:hypothetical protein
MGPSNTESIDFGTTIYAKDIEVEPRDVLRVYFATSLSGELGWQFEKIRMFAGKLDWNPSAGDKNVEHYHPISAVLRHTPCVNPWK